MLVWVSDFAYREASWIELSVDRTGNFPALASLLFSKRALLENSLRRAQVELSQQLPPMLDTRELAGWETGTFFSWMQFSGETLFQPPCFLTAASEAVDEWHRRFRLFEFRIERLSETVRLLRQRSRLLNLAIGLLLQIPACTRFLFQLVRRERSWYLLHGSHPPRPDAAICLPAFAEPGRVGSARVR